MFATLVTAAPEKQAIVARLHRLVYPSDML
ncbi:MAG: hypothetical protein QOJ51_2388 [Acidobacteriaceae bacterium]|jgi:hypothetical protein|nr:hypothetical protein [Acidobacteriaceae bacterium]